MSTPIQSELTAFVKSQLSARETAEEILQIYVGVVNVPASGSTPGPAPVIFYSIDYETGVMTNISGAGVECDISVLQQVIGGSDGVTTFDMDGASFAFPTGNQVSGVNDEITCCDWRGDEVWKQAPVGNGIIAGPCIVNGRVYWFEQKGSFPSPITNHLLSKSCFLAADPVVDVQISNYIYTMAASYDRQRFVTLISSGNGGDTVALMSADGVFGLQVVTTEDRRGVICMSDVGDSYTLGPRVAPGSAEGFRVVVEPNEDPVFIRDPLLDFPNLGITFEDIEVAGNFVIASGGRRITDRLGNLAHFQSFGSASRIFFSVRPLIQFLNDATHDSSTDPYTILCNQVFGDPITAWSLDVSPPGMDINVETGRITWDSTQVGTHPITVRGTNAADYDTKSYTLTVT